MKRVLVFAQIAALLGVTAICVCVVLLFLQVRWTLMDANTQVHAITQKAAADLDKVALDLDEVHRVLLESGLTAMEARKASAEERAALPKLTAQTSQALDSLDALVISARTTTQGIGDSQQQIAKSAVGVLATTDATVRGLQPVMEQARASLVQLQTVETDLDKQVNDPAIASSLHNVDKGTAALAASAADVQQEVHAITHPGWLHRAWGWSLDVVHAFNPLFLMVRVWL